MYVLILLNGIAVIYFGYVSSADGTHICVARLCLKITVNLVCNIEFVCIK
jgi:hypothetical protein